MSEICFFSDGITGIRTYTSLLVIRNGKL